MRGTQARTYGSASVILRHILLSIIAAAAVLVMSAPLRVSAASALVSPEILSDGRPDPVTDAGELLTSSEEEALRRRIYELRSEYSFDVVVLTVETTGGRTATEYADDFYDYGGYGLDSEGSGILLLVAIGDRTWATSTKGRGIAAFTDTALGRLEDRVIPELSGGNYYGAFSVYLSGVESQLDRYYDDGSLKATDVLICIVIGMLLALIPLFIQMQRMRTVRQAAGAEGYHSAGGLRLRVNRDTFIRHVVTSTPIPRDDGPRSGGGSAVHISSSGSSHGGHSGRF